MGDNDKDVQQKGHGQREVAVDGNEHVGAGEENEDDGKKKKKKEKIGFRDRKVRVQLFLNKSCFIVLFVECMEINAYADVDFNFLKKISMVL